MTRSLIPLPLRIARSDTGAAVSLTKRLGNGGTGEVWAAKSGDADVAVKWFYPAHASAGLKRHLAALAAMPAPAPQVGWPTAVVGAEGVDGFGVLLPLRAGRFRTLADHAAGRVSVAALTSVLAAVRFCRLWQDLVDGGLLVTDWSLQDVAFDADGDIWFCNPEGLRPANAANAVAGEPLRACGPLLAPELFAQVAEPSADANRYALAAVLLALLVRARPDALPADPAAWPVGWRDGFGSVPVDGPRGPGELPPSLARWLGLPSATRGLFAAALDPAADPVARPTPAQWTDGLTAFRDALLACPHDGTPFAATADPVTAGTFDAPMPCPACGRPQSPFPQVRITPPDGEPPRTVVLTAQSPVVFADRLRPGGDPLVRVGYVRPHPSEPAVFGYVNQSPAAAQWTAADGVVTPVPSGKPVRLVPGGVLVQDDCALRFVLEPADRPAPPVPPAVADPAPAAAATAPRPVPALDTGPAAAAASPSPPVSLPAVTAAADADASAAVPAPPPAGPVLP